MKNFYLPAFALLLAGFTSSCSSTNSIALTTEKVGVMAAPCNVVFTDGDSKSFTTLKLVTGVLKTPYLLADGEQKLDSKIIKAYHDGKRYAIRQSEFYAGAKGHVATDVLPGFAVREIAGSINVYSLQFYKNGNIGKKYFLQLGTNAAIIPYSLKDLAAITQDNPEISLQLKKYKRNLKSKQLLAVVSRYNSGKDYTVK